MTESKPLTVLERVIVDRFGIDLPAVPQVDMLNGQVNQ